MKLRSLILVVSIAILLASFLAPYACQRLDEWTSAVHQRAVTRELADWEREYRQPHTWEEARRTVDMLECVQHYYVPGPGYHSDKETEAKLEAQRAQTVHALVIALKKFTGKDFRVDAQQWRAWLAKPRPAKHG